MSKKTRNLLRFTAFVLFMVFAGMIVYVARIKTYSLLHAPLTGRTLPVETPADYKMEFEDVVITNPQGMNLNGWFIPSRNGAVIIMQHGYRGVRSEMLDEAALIHEHGYGVMVTSIRAHDRNDGELITLGYYEIQDMQAWYDYLLTRDDFDHERIGILGNSYGGMLSIQFASVNGNIKAVATDSAFSSMKDTVGTSVKHFAGVPEFPFVPLIVFWAEYDTGIKIEEIDATRWISKISPRPVFLMQGGKDTVVSPNSGQLLYDAAGEPKELWFDPDLGHVQFLVQHPAEYESRVVAFFDTYLPGK